MKGWLESEDQAVIFAKAEELMDYALWGRATRK